MLTMAQKWIRLTKENRLYSLAVPLIGLTGGVASGKSSVTQLLQKKGAAIICADRLIKDIYELPHIKEWFTQNSPEFINNSKIQFSKLREAFFNNPKLKKKIEALLYSHLEMMFYEHLKKWENPSFVIYDVPLLFEKKMESFFDMTLLVYTSKEQQIERLMKRDQIDKDLAMKMLSHQIPIDEKKQLATLTINNQHSLSDLENEVDLIWKKIIE